MPNAPGWKPGTPTPPDPLAGREDDPNIDAIFRAAVSDLTTAAAAGIPPTFGKRKDEYLPFLVIRSNPGDRGNRPIGGVSWESPDIFIAPDLDAASAPQIPPTLAGLAKAGVPNTLWAHVWNVGRGLAVNARVEFYWFEPTAAPDASNAHLIGVAHVDLGDRFSGRSHTIVKCPTTWIPQYLNGGHECLIVRLFEPMLDALGPDPWASWDDRHVGQRNITVVDAASPAAIALPLRLGCATGPGPATIEVTTARASDVPWLGLLQAEGKVLADADAVEETYGLTYPTGLRSAIDRGQLAGLDPRAAKPFLRSKIDFTRGCDEVETMFYLRVDGLRPGQCRIYRVRQVVGGRTLSGYTVVARHP